MSQAEVIELTHQLLITSLLLVAPAVTASLIVGLLISIFQTVTSIQEQTLSFAPRILAVGVIIAVTLPWCLQIAINFTQQMFGEMSGVLN